jgi:membrane protease subunit (stomatin/prohibitin family)
MMEFEPMQYPEYRHYKSICDELEELFRCGMQGQPIGGGNAGVPTREQMVQQLMDATMDAMAAVTAGVPAAAAAPAPAAKSVPAVCPNCHAPTDGGKFCEYCGSPL